MKSEKRVDKVELNEKHTRLRLVLMITALAVAAGAFSYGIYSWLHVDSGWTVIESGAAQLSCAQDFTLRYELGRRGRSAAAERRELTKLYTEACGTAWQLFTAAESSGDTVGISWLNRHPNTETTIDAALWQSLQQALANGRRWLYLGPVAECCDALISSQTDSEAALMDPYQSVEQAEFVASVMRYIGDPAQVELRLLPENRACLFVSDTYRAFAEEWGIGRYLDFHWRKNAYVADYLAQRMTAAGFPDFLLSSVDGFARGMAENERFALRLSVYGDSGTEIAIAEGSYPGPASMVCISAGQPGQSYRYADGTLRTAYLSEQTGLDSCPLDTLLALSGSEGCVPLLEQVDFLLTGKEAEDDALQALSCSFALVRGTQILTDGGAALHLDRIAEGYTCAAFTEAQ